MNCENCKKSIIKIEGEAYDHQCARCRLTLCRQCDDTTNVLKWYEIGEKDLYLCGLCITLGIAHNKIGKT